MPKSDRYIIGYATAICLVSSLLLAGTTALLKPRQDREVELDRKFNVLKALQAPVQDAQGRRIPAADIEKLYAGHVRETVLDPATTAVLPGKRPSDYTDRELDARKALPLYLWSDETAGPVTRYALPISGKGLWSTIYGYLALDGRAETVLGVTFYRHAETPGLGGEVEKEWFQKNFAGLTAWRDGAWRRIEVAKGLVGGQRQTAAAEQVDGISGATLTGDGVNKFLNADLKRYAPYFDARRTTEGAADGR